MAEEDADTIPDGALQPEATDAERLAFHRSETQALADLIHRRFPDEIGKGNPDGETAVEVAIRLLAEFAEVTTPVIHAEHRDALIDLRFDQEADIESVHHLVLSGRMSGRRFGSYPVEFRGAVLSVISMEVDQGKWRPLAMVMPDDKWDEQVIPRSHTFAASKEGDDEAVAAGH